MSRRVRMITRILRVKILVRMSVAAGVLVNAAVIAIGAVRHRAKHAAPNRASNGLAARGRTGPVPLVRMKTAVDVTTVASARRSSQLPSRCVSFRTRPP
jgi:hypothetical protein